MARRCTVCSRPDAGAVNALLAEGRSARSVAVGRGISEDAMQRHAANHVADPRKNLRRVAQERQGTRTDLAEPLGNIPTSDAGPSVKSTKGGKISHPSHSDDPLDELVDALRTQALAGNPAIVHQYRLALAAQADVRHAAPPTRNLATEPEWIALRLRLLVALEPFTEARGAVVDAIGDM